MRRHSELQTLVTKTASAVTSRTAAPWRHPARAVTSKKPLVRRSDTKPASVAISRTRARASQCSAPPVTRCRPTPRTASWRPGVSAAIARMVRAVSRRRRPARLATPAPRCPASMPSPSTKTARAATVDTALHRTPRATLASAVTPIGAIISRTRRAARTVTYSKRQIAVSRHTERHDAVDVKIGPDEGPVVGGDVLVTSTTNRVQLEIWVRSRRRQAVASPTAGLCAVDLRPARGRVRAARSVPVWENSAVAGGVLARSTAVGRGCCVSERGAREAHFCGQRRIEVARVEHFFRYYVALLARHRA
jgi:hypothetical protein